MNNNYEDIINLPHHVSTKRARMSMANRAAQFAPFAALVGYDETIKETARLVDKPIILDEQEKAILDMKQSVLLSMVESEPEISITYFIPDDRKYGGRYTTVNGKLKSINQLEREIIMVDGGRIDLDAVINIGCEFFEVMDY